MSSQPCRLSQASRPVVEATLPVVAENVAEIARRFYRRMFSLHPELLDGVFNRGNQASGDQPVALAGSVAAFAHALVHTPDRLPDALLSRVAHRHASLGVRPDQYAVVHDNLFWAIGDVLGDAATPEVAAAWDEVYWLMARRLVDDERDLYRGRALDPEGVWASWRVTELHRETDDVTSFAVERVGDEAAQPSAPGQYVSVRVEMPDGVRQPRQYSLTRVDDGRHRWFAVKRVRGVDGPDGEVSTVLTTAVAVGDLLELSEPFGDVLGGEVLDAPGREQRPLVLLSAGAGVTPVAGVLSHLVAAGSRRRVVLVHADRSAASFALREQVLEDVAALPGASAHVVLEEGGGEELRAHVTRGRLDLDAVDLPAGAVHHVCGPLPFLRAVRTDLLARGVPAGDVHHEVFGPDLWAAELAVEEAADPTS